jgi:hypothetical protein
VRRGRARGRSGRRACARPSAEDDGDGDGDEEDAAWDGEDGANSAARLAEEGVRVVPVSGFAARHARLGQPEHKRCRAERGARGEQEQAAREGRQPLRGEAVGAAVYDRGRRDEREHARAQVEGEEQPGLLNAPADHAQLVRVVCVIDCHDGGDEEDEFDGGDGGERDRARDEPREAAAARALAACATAACHLPLRCCPCCKLPVLVAGLVAGLVAASLTK